MKMNRRFFLFAGTSLALVFFFSLPALAAEAEGHGSYWKDYIFQIVNFIILLAILFKFLRTPLKGYLEKRHNQVREELEKARELSAAADAAYKRAQDRLENLENEVKEIREQMLHEVAEEKTRLMEEAEKKAEQIRVQAQQGLYEEIAQIKKQLERNLSLEALTLAEKIIKERITEKDQKHLIDQFIQRIGSNN
jgi:F-type H+-transporting ATPase subunit b